MKARDDYDSAADWQRCARWALVRETICAAISFAGRGKRKGSVLCFCSSRELFSERPRGFAPNAVTDGSRHFLATSGKWAPFTSRCFTKCVVLMTFSSFVLQLNPSLFYSRIVRYAKLMSTGRLHWQSSSCASWRLALVVLHKAASNETIHQELRINQVTTDATTLEKTVMHLSLMHCGCHTFFCVSIASWSIWCAGWTIFFPE